MNCKGMDFGFAFLGQLLPHEISLKVGEPSFIMNKQSDPLERLLSIGEERTIGQPAKVPTYSSAQTEGDRCIGPVTKRTWELDERKGHEPKADTGTVNLDSNDHLCEVGPRGRKQRQCYQQ